MLLAKLHHNCTASKVRGDQFGFGHSYGDPVSFLLGICPSAGHILDMEEGPRS